MIEAFINVLIGFGINFVANLYVLRAFGFYVSPSGAFYIGLIFTAISVARSYVIRRWAQQHLRAAIHKLTRWWVTYS